MAKTAYYLIKDIDSEDVAPALERLTRIRKAIAELSDEVGEYDRELGIRLDILAGVLSAEVEPLFGFDGEKIIEIE